MTKEISSQASDTTKFIKIKHDALECAGIYVSSDEHINIPNLSPTSSSLYTFDYNVFPGSDDMKDHIASSCDSEDSTHTMSPQLNDFNHSETQDPPSVELLNLHLSRFLQQQNKSKLQQILTDLTTSESSDQDQSLLRPSQFPLKAAQVENEDSDHKGDISSARKESIVKESNKAKKGKEIISSALSTERSKRVLSKSKVVKKYTLDNFRFVFLFIFSVITFLYGVERTDRHLSILQHDALLVRMEIKTESLEQTYTQLCKD
uniref:Uncharacterized protein n=1 Tax=Eucampia antarctica TaxID=49252 RepID=A0A7S2SGI8_9STRA